MQVSTVSRAGTRPLLSSRALEMRESTRQVRIRWLSRENLSFIHLEPAVFGPETTGWVVFLKMVSANFLRPCVGLAGPASFGEFWKDMTRPADPDLEGFFPIRSEDSNQ